MSQGQDWADRAMVPLRGLATPDYNGIYIAVGALGESAGPRLVEVIARLAVTAPEPDQRADELEAIFGSRPRHDCAGWDCANCEERDNALRDLLAAPSPLTPAPTDRSEGSAGASLRDAQLPTPGEIMRYVRGIGGDADRSRLRAQIDTLYAAAQRTGCPHIRSSAEGTSYCALAERSEAAKESPSDSGPAPTSEAVSDLEVTLLLDGMNVPYPRTQREIDDARGTLEEILDNRNTSAGYVASSEAPASPQSGDRE